MLLQTTLSYVKLAARRDLKIKNAEENGEQNDE